MKEKVNTAEFGISLQYYICEKNGINITNEAEAQFEANFTNKFNNKFDKILPKIYAALPAKPKVLKTYGSTAAGTHNFILANGETLSIRTAVSSGKIAPRVVGQAGYAVLNQEFGEIYGSVIASKEDIKKLVYYHIAEMMPEFIYYLFESDYTAFVLGEKDVFVIPSKTVKEMSFKNTDFTFSSPIENWNESITLRYRGKSIAEIQVHRNRTFKFRFVGKVLYDWLNIVQKNTETFGISAEAAICKFFDLRMPESFATRADYQLVEKLVPVIGEFFARHNLPFPIAHTGSLPGDRGQQSKCSYDFVLEGNKTLSLKTNTGNKVCPPEVGQPGSETCFNYFQKFLSVDAERMTPFLFKEMVFNYVEKILPIYLQHLFDSDYLLWIRSENRGYVCKVLPKLNPENIPEFKHNDFSFSKNTISEWKESNSVRYKGVSIGEFQVHNNRDCYKFRFNLVNVIKFLEQK